MKKKKVKEHKFKFDPVNNPDSIWSRSSSKRIEKQPDAEKIKQMLGIEDEEPEDISTKTPLKMMDIIYQTWGLEADTEEDREEEKEEEEEDEGMD